MGQLTQWQVDQVIEEQLTYVLFRQLGSMELATQVARAGMSRIAAVRCHASEKVATTLAVADDLVKAASYAGHVTPEIKEEVRRHTERYLDDMLGIAHDAGSRIVDVLLRD